MWTHSCEHMWMHSSVWPKSRLCVAHLFVGVGHPGLDDTPRAGGMVAARRRRWMAAVLVVCDH